MKDSDYKEETKNTYEKFADIFDEKFELYQREFIKNEIDEFLKRLSPRSRILDIGSGSGNHAFYFKENNHDVLCIDISEQMIKRCREKGLNAQLMDFEKLTFQENTFDGVCAYTSLLHTTKKNIKNILNKIFKILKPGGVFFLGMKAGNEEGFVINGEKYPGAKRWFSLYTDHELRRYFNDNLKIEFFSKTNVNEKTFLNYIIRKI